jgi:hypothetical protein
MSALGQEQTCAAQKVMSTLPPKADICGAITNVRFANGGHLSGTDRRIDLDQEIARPIRVSEAAPKLIFGRQHVRSGGACTGIFSFQQMGLNWLSMQ